MNPLQVIEQIGQDQADQHKTLSQVERERDIYRKALWRIADAESGTWGWIAHQALREGRG